MTIKPIDTPKSIPALAISSGISEPASSPITLIALEKIPSSMPKESSAVFPIPAVTVVTIPHSTTSSQLAEIIRTNPNITTLNLEGCPLLKDEDFQQIAKLTRLTHLSIKGCPRITGTGLKDLNSCSSLKYLTLEHTNTGPSLESAAALSSLRGLHVIDCNITNEGLKALTSDKLPFLEQLNLTECSDISDEGIIESIVKLSSLKELHLEQCGNITDKSLEKLSTLPALERLHLHGYGEITDKGIEYLAKSKSLNELDCSGYNNLTVKALEQLKPSLKLKVNKEFFEKAVNKKDAALLSFLLKRGVQINQEEFHLLFYTAVATENKECVKIFLEHGFDPDTNITYDELTTTPFNQALKSGDLELIALMLCYRKDKSKPLPILTELLSILPKNPKPVEYEKVMARGFGPLLSTDMLRLYSSYAISELRQKAAPFFTQRLLRTPLHSIEHIINPMISFVAKETLSDPEFAVYILPARPGKELGQYSHKTGDISLFIAPNQGQTTLLHEIAHKIVDKLGWHSKDRASQIKDFTNAVKQDIATLKTRHCDKIIIGLLSGVEKSYSQKEKHFEEYVVRTVEIISDIANQHPEYTREQLEMVLMRDIPHLYKIFKENFLPELEAYNRASPSLS